MKPNNRLRKELDITKVLKSKKGVFDAACGIKFVKTDKPDSRFAVVVSTKVSKEAVDRNRVRRQYREILTKMIPSIHSGYDILLLTSKPAIALDFSEKEKKLQYVFKKSGLLKV
jgi:ribonuclease P protein component